MKKLLALLGCFLLSGCAVYSNKFDCPPGPSTGCESVSTVNAMIDNNVLEDYLNSRDPEPKKELKKVKINEREIKNKI